MAKTKKTTKTKAPVKVMKKVRKVTKVAKKGVMHKEVDNKFSLLLIVVALLVFVLAALAMGK